MKINMEVYKFHFDKELLLEMSASITLYSGQLTLITTQLLQQILSCDVPDWLNTTVSLDTQPLFTNFSSCNSTIITVGQKNISKHIVLQQKWSQTVNYNKNNKVWAGNKLL